MDDMTGRLPAEVNDNGSRVFKNKTMLQSSKIPYESLMSLFKIHTTMETGKKAKQVSDKYAANKPSAKNHSTTFPPAPTLSSSSPNTSAFDGFALGSGAVGTSINAPKVQRGPGNGEEEEQRKPNLINCLDLTVSHTPIEFIRQICDQETR